MHITFLDVKSLGEDMTFDPFRVLGEITVYESTAPKEVAARLADTDVVVINKIKLNETNLSGAKRLRLICLAATGFDNVDLSYCRAHGIAVCNVVGYSTQSVAQLTVTMALSLLVHLPQYHAHIASGAYTEGGVANCLTPVYHEIAGMTWGIVGFGNIGRQVGAVARALNCRVLVNKRVPVDGWECVDFDRICRESDILSIHTPLNDSTSGLLDRAHIAMLKPNAIVINVARGAVTDEAALAEAVANGSIGGIGIDVYSTEPMPKEHPFYAIRNLPNVCLTPHMAWGGYETRVRLLEEIIENIRDFYNGGKRNRVD